MDTPPEVVLLGGNTIVSVWAIVGSRSTGLNDTEKSGLICPVVSKIFPSISDGGLEFSAATSVMPWILPPNVRDVPLEGIWVNVTVGLIRGNLIVNPKLELISRETGFNGVVLVSVKFSFPDVSVHWIEFLSFGSSSPFDWLKS